MLMVRRIAFGAVSGGLAALLVDLRAWSADATQPPYNWRVALTHVVIGAVTGAGAGAGLTGAGA